MHGLCDIGSVNRVVVGVRAVIPLLDQTEQLPSLSRVQVEMSQEAVHLEEMHA